MGLNRLTKEWIEVLAEGGIQRATVTKEWVEVLAKYPTNKAQVSKYWIEVLAKNLSRFTTDTLTLSEDLDYTLDTAPTPGSVSGSTSDTLTFTELVHPALVRRVLTDTLSFVQEVTTQSHLYVTDTLTFTEKLREPKHVFFRQKLVFVETIDNGIHYTSDYIPFSQEVEANIKYRDIYEVLFLTEILVGVNLNTTASDSLVFIETIRQNFYSYSVSDVLNLIEQVQNYGIQYMRVADTLTFGEQLKLLRKIGLAIDTIVFSEKLKYGGTTKHSVSDTLVILEQIRRQLEYTRTAAQTLSFGEVAAKGPFEQLSETITFIETLLACEYQSIWQDLVLAETLLTNTSKGGVEQLEFTQVVSRSIEFNRAPGSDTLNFSQSLSAFLFKNGKPKYTSLSISAPPSTPQSYITVAYPTLASPTFSFTLKAPALQNTDELEITRVSRTTRANERDIYNKVTWPKVRRFKYSFDNVCLDEMVAMRQFLINTLGFECELLDYEGNTWLVFIDLYNPDISENYPDRYSFDIVFRRSENI